MKNIIYSLVLVFSFVVLTALTDDPPKIPPTIPLESPNDPYFWVRFDTTATDTTHRMFLYAGEYGWFAFTDSTEIWDKFVPYRNSKDSLITSWPIISTKLVGDTVQIDGVLVWKNDTILKDSLVYVDIKPDSLRLRYINGSWSKWYWTGDKVKEVVGDSLENYVTIAGVDTITGNKDFQGKVAIDRTSSGITEDTYGLVVNTTQNIGGGTHQLNGIRNVTTYTGNEEQYRLRAFQSGAFHSGTGKVSGDMVASANFVFNSGGAETSQIDGVTSVVANNGKFNKISGFNTGVTNTSTDAANNDMYGFVGMLNNSGVIDGFSGFQIDAYNTGTINGINGLQLDMWLNGGTQTAVKGIDIGGEHAWQGTSTNMYGIYIDESVNIGTGDNYAIYSNTLADSYFKGKLKGSYFNPDSLNLEDVFVWANDTILKDSLAYFDIKPDSVRLRYINGTYSKWYLSRDIIQNKLDGKEDTLSFYETVVSVDDDVGHTVPFVLRPTAHVWFNGTLLKQDDWTGAGTTELTILGNVKVYDIIKIQN